MKNIGRVLTVALLFVLGGRLAHAQRSIDAYFGVGTAKADATGNPIDTFGNGTLYTTPKLDGAFGKAGAEIMLTPHFGVGGEADFRFSEGNYAGLKYRPTFYDFNLIWHPVQRFARVVPEFQAGLGAANLKFYYSQSSCDSFAGCNNSSTFLESSNHFQTHLAAGVRFYVTPHIFLRPQVDARWVNNFFQFGSNWVPEYSAAVGYSFGAK